MPLAGTPPPHKRRKPTKLILELTQEAMPQEVSRLNLGKKISIPRDVMLEELSLLTNRGSKMFKLRQQRVEKFIYENNPDVFSDNSVDHFQKFIPSGHYGVDSYGYSQSGGRMVSGVTVGRYGSGKLHYPPAPPAKPGSKGGPGWTGASAGGIGAGSERSAGTGGGVESEGDDTTGGKGDNKGGSGKQVSIFKTYLSPWEQALGLTPQEKSQFELDLLSYGQRVELHPYKSFNRTAMPYGGYEKAIKLMTYQMPEFDVGPFVPEPIIVYSQEVTSRPSFNRTPVPWQGSGEPTQYNIHVNVPLAGETEAL